MSTTLRFQDHEEFQRAALHMTVAGCAAGLLAHVAGLAVSALGELAAPLSLALIAMATAFGAARPDERIQLRALASLVLAGLLGATALYVFRTREPSLGVALFALVFGFVFARGKSGSRFVLALATAAGALFLARFVMTSFFAAEGLRSMPTWLLSVVAGGAFAGVAVLALLPRHLELWQDVVEDAWKQTAPHVDGELKELIERARTVWSQVDETLDADAAPRKDIQDSVVRLFDVARRVPQVEQKGRTSVELRAELEALGQKMANTSDEVARAQYQKACDALGEQLGYLADIANSRERVVARAHHYVAAMERLRFSVIKNRSADASRLSADVQPLLDDLEALGKEIDLASEVSDEVEKTG